MTSLDLRRLAIAVACSIALHEAVVALIPRTAPPAQERETVTHVTIARVERRPPPTPPPTPRPTPTPPPVHVVVHATLNSGRHAHVERIKHVGARRPTPPKSHFATPDVAALPTGGTGAGAQNGTDAGSTSTVEGNGNGTGSQGSGNGAKMCGAVDFESEGPPQFDAATSEYVRTNIIATVYYADGSSERIPLDWAWHWKSEDDDPFNNTDALMLFQFPPPDKVAGEPPAIAYIIAHTTPTGHTRLTDQCPNIPPPPPTPHSNRAAAAEAARQ